MVGSKHNRRMRPKSENNTFTATQPSFGFQIFDHLSVPDMHTVERADCNNRPIDSDIFKRIEDFHLREFCRKNILFDIKKISFNAAI